MNVRQMMAIIVLAQDHNQNSVNMLIVGIQAPFDMAFKSCFIRRNNDCARAVASNVDVAPLIQNRAWRRAQSNALIGAMIII